MDNIIYIYFLLNLKRRSLCKYCLTSFPMATNGYYRPNKKCCSEFCTQRYKKKYGTLLLDYKKRRKHKEHCENNYLKKLQTLRGVIK